MLIKFVTWLTRQYKETFVSMDYKCWKCWKFCVECAK